MEATRANGEADRADTWGEVLGALVLAAAGFVLVGAALASLWGWFLVPLGAPSINVAHAVGLYTTLMLLARLSGLARETAPRRARGQATQIMQACGVTLTGWGVGYIAHLLM